MPRSSVKPEGKTMTKRLLPVIGLCLVAVACGRKEAPPAASAPAPAPVSAPAAEMSAETAKDAAAVAVANAPSAPLPMNGATVDVCGLVSRADVESVLGALSSDPKPSTPQGSLLGGCEYHGTKIVLLTVSARPGAEWDGTIAYAKKNGKAEDVPGVGKAAVQTDYGLMVKLDQPYFLSIFGAGGNYRPLAKELVGKMKF
jgi:hypothetical protein